MKKGMMSDYVRLLKLENAELRKLGPANLTLEKQKQQWLKAFRKEQYMGNSLFDAMMCRIEEISKDGSPEQQATILELKSVVEGAQKRVHLQHNEIVELKAEADRRKDDVGELHEALSQWEDYFFILGDQYIDDSLAKAEKFVDISKDLEDLQADSAADRAELIVKYHEIMDSYAAETEKYKNELNQIKPDDQGKNEIEKTLAAAKKMIKELQSTIYEDKKYKYDLEQKIADMAIENSELKALKDKNIISDDHSGCRNEKEKATINDEKIKSGRPKWPAKDLIIGDTKKEEPAADIKQTTPKSKVEKDVLIDIKNKLCNKNYEVQHTGKSLLAKKPGARHIEVLHAELPGSVKYIICGQTCYEFDQAIKASAHGVKTIVPKPEAEVAI